VEAGRDAAFARGPVPDKAKNNPNPVRPEFPAGRGSLLKLDATCFAI